MNNKIAKGIALILFGILLCVAGIISGIAGLVMIFAKNKDEKDK